jgi:uncharacterized phosphosugar-binding protein
MEPLADNYLNDLVEILQGIRTSQSTAIDEAALLCADSIANNGLVHAFGSGHSRIVVEELWPRYGSFPGFHPIVELSLTAHHQVVGANGQRQAMFLENVPGLAVQILRNFSVSSTDVALTVSSGGTGVVAVEFAEEMKKRGLKVIAITAVEQSRHSAPKAPSGRRLVDVADIVLDTSTPPTDASITVPGIPFPVGPTTTVAAVALANALKVQVAQLLAARDIIPFVLPNSLSADEETKETAFNDAYDEHSRRVARLYQC